MDKKLYKAFTLIEMLIVTGVIMVLMVLSVATARFAIDRSNEIEHRAGAEQLFNALQTYADNQVIRVFPPTSDTYTLAHMTTGPNGLLVKYLSGGSFKGGKEATYYYFNNSDSKKALVCVTLGGIKDELNKGIFCIGNGFNDTVVFNSTTNSVGSVDVQKIEYSSDVASIYQKILLGFPYANWDGEKWDTTIPTVDSGTGDQGTGTGGQGTGTEDQGTGTGDQGTGTGDQGTGTGGHKPPTRPIIPGTGGTQDPIDCFGRDCGYTLPVEPGDPKQTM